MVDPQAQPILVDTAENPLPEGGESDWLYLNRGKVWLRFAAWPATVDEPQGTVIIATGRAEFIEKYFETIEDIQARGFAVAAFDWRGQGGSSRLLRNVTKGHVASFDDYVDDLEAAVAAAALRGLPRPFYLLAHSMGGAVALLAAGRLANQIERMVLTAPLIELADKRASSRWAKNAASVAAAIGLARSSVRPRRAPAPQDVPFQANVVTSDRRRFARTQAVLKAEPRLGLGAPTVRWYAAANRATRTLNEAGFADELKIPVLVVACGMDTVVSVRAIERFAKTLRGGGRVMIPGARHEILMERTGFRTLFWAAFDAFVPGTGLRLPTEIAPPRIKIAPPKGKVTASVPAVSPGDARQGGEAQAPAGDTASAVDTRPTDATATDAPAATAGPVAEAGENAVQPAALAPAAPEAAVVAKRSRFGFFRRRKTAEADAADGASAPETAPTERSKDDADRSAARGQPNAAEVAFTAAAHLVAEATRGEARPSRQAAPEPSGTAEPASSAAPDAQSGPATQQASADPATVRTSGGDGPSRVSRLFRRRDGSATEAAAPPPEAPSGETPSDPSGSAADPAEAAEAALAEAPAAPAEPQATEPTAALPENPSEPKAAAATDADMTATITFKAASAKAPPADAPPAAEDLPLPQTADAGPPEPGDATAEAEADEPPAHAGSEAVDDGEPAPGADPSQAAGAGRAGRRKVGSTARPIPRPVKRKRKR